MGPWETSRLQGAARRASAPAVLTEEDPYASGACHNGRMSSGVRSQAARDALTVEIGYALASAAFAGGVVFAVIAGPVLVWDVPHPVHAALVTIGAIIAGLLAVTRTAHVLRRHTRQNRPGR